MSASVTGRYSPAVTTNDDLEEECIEGIQAGTIQDLFNRVINPDAAGSKSPVNNEFNEQPKESFCTRIMNCIHRCCKS